ncbi:YcaO-like family protein [Streptomyces sp. XD-27]|uniref:YcaO-like family protein n=1 Tax=Streptomyces sp. XD-27 TaxID=3062779 RepID=UPI0026F4250F|nr:YcaO-like family protein [Streptomyces sp. XD-27]WKX71161.1 YcaO-like family protein [Streptomyces sp. XD-27]
MWGCELVDTAGVSVAAGTGKARADTEARARALGEALERLLAGPAGLDRAAVHFTAAGRLAAGVLAGEASAPLLAQHPDRELACLTYRSLHADEDEDEDANEVSIPLFLGAPWYAGPDGQAHRDALGDRTDYGALSRYAVGSGYGLGPTRTRATVHALLETIERDACSLLTLRMFLAGRPPVVLDPATLPDGLAALHRCAEREASARVHLVDATGDLGVPTVLAYSPPSPPKPYVRGQAAALSRHDAVAGALTEHLESATARRRAPARPVPLTVLEPYPALHRCGRFDLTDALRQARSAPFRDHPAPDAPADQLTELLVRLRAGGFTAYQRRIARLPGGADAVHTVVPGLERFFAVVKGALILPGPRGRAVTRLTCDHVSAGPGEPAGAEN